MLARQRQRRNGSHYPSEVEDRGGPGMVEDENEDRVAITEPDLADDEDGYPWDSDRDLPFDDDRIEEEGEDEE